MKFLVFAHHILIRALFCYSFRNTLNNFRKLGVARSMINYSVSSNQHSVNMEVWDSYKARFGNVAKLYDRDASLYRLWNSSCCVIGLGGVGSWVCEGLIRSGVRSITLIDMDDICISNTNRQLHALSSSVSYSYVRKQFSFVTFYVVGWLY